MKKYSTLAFALFFILSITGCTMEMVTGTGNITTQKFALQNFEEIEVESHCDVDIYRDSTYSVTVSEYENLMQYLKLEVVGKKLLIGSKPNNISINNSRAKAVIHMPDVLHKLIISGSSDITMKSGFKDISHLYVSGSGNIKGEESAQMNNISASVDGSGDITMIGTANNVNLSVAGSGNIDFSNIQALTGDCSIDGSGDIKVNASNTLDASINGSGDIYYYGNPTVAKTINGSGKIVKR
ncbi:MAG: DUF2807 domain-containing protein [Bacteroidetes bacterium]|nr:DUF2807 domain-containing protein [Bacteroidota bacterium]